jgi:SpoVK/Ycf46/Vps4 family AAA+-type ATPase
MLDADLYRIDLAAVVSKYLGETAARLYRVLDTAEQSGAVLLLDEADALLGTPTHVKGGDDRYADAEIDYLLQRIEAYRGVVIVTIGRRRRGDRAFFRRCDFVIRVPSPRARQRRRRAKNA